MPRRVLRRRSESVDLLGNYHIAPANRSQLPDTAAAPAIDKAAASLRGKNILAMAYKVPSSYL